MNIDEYGQISRNESEILDIIYQNPDIDLSELILDNEKLADIFNQYSYLLKTPVSIQKYQKISKSVKEYDQENENIWFLPNEVFSFDIVTYLFEKTQNEEQRSRVLKELELYYKFNMLDILLISKYLVDTFRENNIVWGVGRGSSVASYCLFLIGLHKIDSLKYNLDIEEFLK
jgi:DNA polymerase III alpha subunit